MLQSMGSQRVRHDLATEQQHFSGQVVWYSHLFKNFPQSVVIRKVKGFVVVNKAEIEVFLKLSCFFDNPKNGGLPYFLLRQDMVFSFSLSLP